MDPSDIPVSEMPSETLPFHAAAIGSCFYTTNAIHGEKADPLNTLFSGFNYTENKIPICVI